MSRLRFAFVISFHTVFPAFTIGLAAWLATIEGMHLRTGMAIYRRLFDFWLKVFSVARCMVSLGTMFSSFWIMANNNWMQVPVGHTLVDGKIIPTRLARDRPWPLQLVR